MHVALEQSGIATTTNNFKLEIYRSHESNLIHIDSIYEYASCCERSNVRRDVLLMRLDSTIFIVCDRKTLQLAAFCGLARLWVDRGWCEAFWSRCSTSRIDSLYVQIHKIESSSFVFLWWFFGCAAWFLMVNSCRSFWCFKFTTFSSTFRCQVREFSIVDCIGVILWILNTYFMTVCLLTDFTLIFRFWRCSLLAWSTFTIICSN